MIHRLSEDVRDCMAHAPDRPVGIGISCGGPLDSRTGRILSPPNLPGWDDIPIVEQLQYKQGFPPGSATMPTPVPWQNGVSAQDAVVPACYF